MVTKILAGTSGYSYKGWRGHFYPEDLPQDQWLNYYSRQLPTVEINNTFYRMPQSHVMETWRDAVPDDFQFVIKANRRITHQGRLKNVEQTMGYLLERTGILGEKLGAVLFQLPPYMKMDLERLQSFQSLLPDQFPAAFRIPARLLERSKSRHRLGGFRACESSLSHRYLLPRRCEPGFFGVPEAESRELYGSGDEEVARQGGRCKSPDRVRILQTRRRRRGSQNGGGLSGHCRAKRRQKEHQARAGAGT